MANILVIDDEPGVLHLLSTLLQEEGHAVLSARGGREALGLLEEERIDAIVLDLMMPEMSGWSFLEHLNEYGDSASRPPVAILSAVFRDDAIRRAREEFGARAYITKPFQIQELIDTLSGIVEEPS